MLTDDEARKLGLLCPRCHCVDSKVTHTRKFLRLVRRRRVCLNLNCGYAFWSSERLPAEPPK